MALALISHHLKEQKSENEDQLKLIVELQYYCQVSKPSKVLKEIPHCSTPELDNHSGTSQEPLLLLFAYRFLTRS